MKPKALQQIENDNVNRLVYKALLQKLHSLGVFKVEAKDSSIQLVHGAAFMDIHPRRNALGITLVTDEPIEHDRIAKVDQVSEHRYHNVLTLIAVPEIDEDFMGWARQAYQLKSGA